MRIRRYKSKEDYMKQYMRDYYANNKKNMDRNTKRSSTRIYITKYSNLSSLDRLEHLIKQRKIELVNK